MKKFIEEVLKSGRFEGCKYKYIDDHYAVVFAWNEEYGLMCKIAFNCDDLQCDYDVDWLLPLTPSEEVVYVELANCQNYAVEDLYNDLKEYYRQVLENDNGLVLDDDQLRFNF